MNNYFLAEGMEDNLVEVSGDEICGVEDHVIMVHGADNIELARVLHKRKDFEEIKKVFCANCGDYFPLSAFKCSCGETDRNE